jgi:pyruvate formate lyase activating enzyme
MIKEAVLYKKEAERMVACNLCHQRCRIAPSKYGICGVRRNVDGTLYTQVYGEVIASHVDPIEKKPLHHFLPGSLSYSIATLGCNFRCGFCQNWQISQSNKRDSSEIPGYELKPEEVIREAVKAGCKSISYTYTEPTVYFEYAYNTAKLARAAGLKNIFVTNGYMTKEALKMINPYLDACNVDLKSFSDKFYKNICGGSLGPVLDSIRLMKELGIWVEVTTLIIPKKNDSKKELNDIAMFIAGLDKDMPWHVSRFHPDYEFEDHAPTPLKTLKMACDIGRRAGLKHVYPGNVPEGSKGVF